MSSLPLTGYYITDKPTIMALTATQRANGYTRATSIGTNAEWYMFIAASTALADGDLVLMPNDNPTTGRWHKYAVNRVNSLPGFTVCTSACTTAAGGSGKAFQFYSPQTEIPLVIVPGFDINIQNVANAICVYRWSQMPNMPRTGQEASPVIQLPNTGGSGVVTITSTYRWISVYARNPANGNHLDGTCFTVAGNVLTLLGYS